ncbi:unnamed protein product [Moneuplotes crassus]|uniref:Serine hydrolase domain-containing protein n=1 Tax=Euplotes crassus TaxID=5936 RepID=A0AAD1XNV9_EUPCR|nr:unnamed protein product [Moneuplotes crassus]
MDSEPKKLRILCIHGYYNNAKVLEAQLDYYQTIFKDYIEFVFVEAPHKIPDQEVYDPRVKAKFEGPFYYWIGSGKGGLGDNETFLESYNFLYEFMEQNGPFDGIYGFSQGGLFVRALVKGKELGFPHITHTPSFMILASPRMPKKYPFVEVIGQDYPIPALYLFDDNDTLEETFINAYCDKSEHTIIRHNKGHSLPKLINEQMNTFIDFISTQYYNKFHQEVQLNFTVDEQFLESYRAQGTEKTSIRSKL